MRFFFYFIFILFSLTSFSQEVSIDKTFYDFGPINKGNVRFVDFKLINTSTKIVYILRADSDKELTIRYSKKTLLPDSIAFVRIQYNPKKLGSFQKKIPLYISSSNEPIILTIKGEVLYIEANHLTECPDFSYAKPETSLQFDLTVTVLDTHTNLPIQNASVLLLKSGLPYQNLLTNEKGISERMITLGLYYVVSNAKGYDTKELSVYLNRQHNSLLVYLTPIQPSISIIDTSKIKLTDVTLLSAKQLNPKLTSKDSIRELLKPIETPVASIADSILYQPLSSAYAPNNIVFLIDVSTSMLNQGKLDLLKASMIQLLEPLRKIDKMTIVTYASVVTNAMPTTEVLDKSKISQLIQALEGGGLTAGDKGIAKAYEICKNEFIINGNNQIILATDGAFKVDHNTQELIDQHALKGISISVVGIKNSDINSENMHAIAERGKGHYLQINNYNDAQRRLIEEIRANSLIK